MVVSCRCSECLCYSLDWVRFKSERYSGPQQFFVHLAMVQFADRSSQSRIVVSACCVMIVHTKNAWWNCEAQTRPLLLPHGPPRAADWALISHAAPPLKAR